MGARHPRLLVGSGITLTLVGVFLLAWTTVGHYHRPSIEAQTATWDDGREQYRFERSDQDTFDPELYGNTRSVDEAAHHIRAHYQPESQEEKLRAAYEFTRQRFLHFMYPHHTWRTNPYLALADSIAPTRSWNQMALADDKLRHSAVASCGHAANVFVEIYRAMGGEAQKVSFSGHDIAEARIGDQRYFVDANLERFVQGGVSEVVESESRLRALYAGYPEERIAHYIDVFQTNAKYWGYEGPSFNSPRIQWMQAVIGWGKWVLPVLLALVGAALVVVGRRRV